VPQPLPPGRAVRVRVPATSANLGPGFDAFGLALALHDEVTVTTTTGGVAVDVAGEGAATVSRGADNLVVRSMLSTLDALGVRTEGIQVSCSNAIPHGRGLGSSAAAIVAGVAAAHALADAPAGAPLLSLATALEGHPDNVAAALLGGFTIAWVDDAGPQAVRLDPNAEISAVAYVAAAPVSTELARGLLPEHVRTATPPATRVVRRCSSRR
jgi:homoserine kinase